MALSVEVALGSIVELPVTDEKTLGALDIIRAPKLDSSGVFSVILDVPDTQTAQAVAAMQPTIEEKLRALDGITDVRIVLTAPNAPKGEPGLKIGRHPTKQSGPRPIPGVDRIIAVGSGKGGVGKSTLTSNLAVALARQGRKVGLLDADIHGPSQPRMMGVTGRPENRRGADGEISILPLTAHGVTLMSIGFMLNDGEAVVWRGPILMGAMQQMLFQVEWGELDVLLIDLPPGTGDVQITLAQHAPVTGALIVSTPQDVALLDASRAINMFDKLKVPVLGLVENMASFICPHCGGASHPFGHGGVASEAKKLELPFLGEIPLELDIRLASDAGRPVSLEDGPVSAAYSELARRLIAGGMA